MSESGRELFDFRRPYPLTGFQDETLPTHLERQFELHGDHTIIEVLDACVETLAGLELGGLDDLLYRRPFETDVLGRGMFETGLSRSRLDPDQGTHSVELDLLSDVE